MVKKRWLRQESNPRPCSDVFSFLGLLEEEQKELVNQTNNKGQNGLHLLFSSQTKDQLSSHFNLILSIENSLVHQKDAEGRKFTCSPKEGEKRERKRNREERKETIETE